jgi:3-vinyl bacteriochlorophyllide hydratase
MRSSPQAACLKPLAKLGIWAGWSCRDPLLVSNSSPKSLSRILYSRYQEIKDPPGRRWKTPVPLYSPEQRRRRDATSWTTVQAVLAPVQFAIFLISAALVVRYLATGEGFALAAGSVVVKTLALYTIMVTGSMWEKAVFGRYLFAPAFFWEDVLSMLVLALHTAYLAALATGALDARGQMYVALAAYVVYLLNAAQFLLKLRTVRRERGRCVDETSELMGFVR